MRCRIGNPVSPAFHPAALDALGHHSSHTPAAEVPLRGTGSRLHGSMKVIAHRQFCLSRRRAAHKSSEHADMNFASLRSCLVFLLWQLRHKNLRFSGVNVLSIAAGPSARATSMARR